MSLVIARFVSQQEEDYIFFDSPWLSLVKTSTMFVGELEFSDIPVNMESRFDLDLGKGCSWNPRARVARCKLGYLQLSLTLDSKISMWSKRLTRPILKF